MSNEIAKLSDIAQSLAWKLRLTQLDKTQKTLRKNRIVDSNGFLTIDGAQVFLDALWQKHPEIQQEIADKLTQLHKEEKDENQS